jgi:ribosomal protein S18 acetylase RimI-like enzyme
MSTAISEIFALRRARSGDASAIARVHVASWAAAYDGLLRRETIAQYDLTHRAIAWQRSLRAGALAWVVTEDELVVGFVEVRGNEVTVLYLHPGWWRLGLGGALLRRGLREIGAAGYREAYLWVLAENGMARSFYGRLGGGAGDNRPVRVGKETLVEIRYAWRLPIPAR